MMWGGGYMLHYINSLPTVQSKATKINHPTYPYINFVLIHYTHNKIFENLALKIKGEISLEIFVANILN